MANQEGDCVVVSMCDPGTKQWSPLGHSAFVGAC
jgi:hypothetical protein